MQHQYGTIRTVMIILVIVGAFNPSADGYCKNNFSGQIDDKCYIIQFFYKIKFLHYIKMIDVSHKPVILNIEQPVSNIIGVANLFGFITDL